MLAIPARVGLEGCAYELHTHDRTGVIHFETAAYHKVRLGDFFEVWGEPLTATNVAGVINKPMSVFVNDPSTGLTEYKGDPRDIEITTHKEITIVLGTAPESIPWFQWPADL